MLLDFGDRTRTGIFNMVWLLAVFFNVVVNMKFILMKYLMFRLRELSASGQKTKKPVKEVKKPASPAKKAKAAAKKPAAKPKSKVEKKKAVSQTEIKSREEEESSRQEGISQKGCQA
jgi:type IV secretory pathway VirB10-like protein